MPERYPREAWIPLVAGLFWLWNAPSHGFVGFFFSVVPGTLLLGSGVSMLLLPGDNRIAQFTAAGGVLGVLFALPSFFVVGFLYGLVLVGFSLASFVASGLHAVRLEPHTDEVPVPEPSVSLWTQVAVDEALLSSMSLTAGLPVGGDHLRIVRELAAARELFEARGWLEKPADFHEAPPPLEAPSLVPRQVRSIRYEKLSFDSGYEPRPEEPGRDRWLSYAANHSATAWVVRHPEPDRPWLVGIHGYRMGHPTVDLAAFPPSWLVEHLGMNLLVPTLPLHGKRTPGRRSGDRFIEGDILDTLHAEAQAMWDLRRLLSWVRAQGAPRVGVMGYSLGGYNASLLASLDDDLACVIAGIPLADFSRAVYRHGPPLYLRAAAHAGLEEDSILDVLRVVSPLVLECKVPHERRYVFGAVCDRLVPPDQVRDLWRHWDRPRIEWYQGGHLTFRAHPHVRQMKAEALRESGLAR